MFITPSQEAVGRKRGLHLGEITRVRKSSNAHRAQHQRTCDHCDRPIYHWVWQSNGTLRLECWEHYRGPKPPSGGMRDHSRR